MRKRFGASGAKEKSVYSIVLNRNHFPKVKNSRYKLKIALDLEGRGQFINQFELF